MWKIIELDPEDPAALPPITVMRSEEGEILGITLFVKNEKTGELSVVGLDKRWANELDAMLEGRSPNVDSFPMGPAPDTND